MTQYQGTPPTTPWPPAGPPATNQPPSAPSANDRASGAVDEAKHAAGDVTDVATDKARDVKDEAVRQARDLAGEARHQLHQQASAQHRNLVGNLRSLGNELGTMRAEQPGLASELVAQAGERVDGVANWLDGREPGQLVDEVRNFARRRPGVFLLGAALAGVAAGRLGRGVAATHPDSGAASAAPSADGQPGQTTAAAHDYAVGATPTTPRTPAHTAPPPIDDRAFGAAPGMTPGTTSGIGPANPATPPPNRGFAP